MSVGISHDTGEFAVQSIHTWWKEMGAPRYPDATSLVITADGGGSNGYRLRLWKLEMQKLVDEMGSPVTVCHLPPGTSKWNKIEHRLFSFITQNWRGTVAARANMTGTVSPDRDAGRTQAPHPHQRHPLPHAPAPAG